MTRKKTTPQATDVLSVPPYAQILSSIGPETTKATELLIQNISEMKILQIDHIFQELAHAMKDVWPDSEAAKVIYAVNEKIDQIDITSLQRWLFVHQGDSNSVGDCISADPPPGVDILKVLSRAGSQKLVFLATWQIAQREVVLKRFRGSDAANRILQRETQTHPLSMSHPNIIETHLLQNKKGEYFLVERRLPLVLYDEWPSNGLQEAANLLRDIASALAFLTEQELVHGDIKPDNIGFEGGRYILLDFGICRPQGAFDGDVTPTGSLRTRAPELIMGEGQHSYMSDVWALGATVFNTLTGRFPLFRVGEIPPRVSNPEEREKCEELLRDRVRNHWSEFIDLSPIPIPLRSLLERMLEREPRNRGNTHEILRNAENELSAVLRFARDTSHISVSEEIKQLYNYLPSKTILKLLPENQRRELRTRIERLREAKGLSTEEVGKLETITSKLP